VSTVRFCSTRLNTLSASPTGGPPIAAVGPVAAASPTSGQGRRLVLVKNDGRTGPTSVHNRYIVLKYSDTHKNDIYTNK
jgi:hypothetical protein